MYNFPMSERKYRAIEWSVSENARWLTSRVEFAGMFFRVGESVPISQFSINPDDARTAIIERRKRLESSGRKGLMVFDIESNFDDLELERLEY